MHYLLTKWPQFSLALVYFVFFLPILVINIMFIYLLFSIPFISLRRAIKVNNNNNAGVKLSEKQNYFVVLKLFSLRLQKELTEDIPFLFARKTIIMPLQAFLLQKYIKFYSAILEGMRQGFRHPPSDIYNNSLKPNANLSGWLEKCALFIWNLLKKLLGITVVLIFSILISPPIICFLIILLNL